MGVFKRRVEIKKKIEQNIKYTPKESIDHNFTTIIGKSLKINGQINAKEQILIQGRVKGKIICESKVIIGSNGNVTADIEADEIIIQGKVKGNVTGYKRVEVITAGNLKGNIISKGVIIAEGAVFKGNIDMNPGNYEKQNITKEPAKKS